MAEAKTDLNGRFDAALSVIKSVATVVASCAILALLLADFNSIRDASQKLLARAGSVTTLKVLGVELSLGQEAVTTALSEYAEQPARSSAGVAAAIAKLEPEEYARLMEIGQLNGLCEFEKPSAKMRGDVALDYGLDEKGLAKVTDDPKTRGDVAAFLERKAAEGEKIENGRPLSCYDLALTDLGRDVKTALVQSFKGAFDPLHGHGEPAAEGRKVAGL